MSDRLPHEKGFHISWEQIHRDSRALAWRLDKQGPGAEGAWRSVVAITRGGMVPACIVARELNVRHVDTISVVSYDHQNQGAAQVLKAPDPSIGDGEGVLVVDDLVFDLPVVRLTRLQRSIDEKVGCYLRHAWSFVPASMSCAPKDFRFLSQTGVFRLKPAPMSCVTPVRTCSTMSADGRATSALEPAFWGTFSGSIYEPCRTDREKTSTRRAHRK